MEKYGEITSEKKQKLKDKAKALGIEKDQVIMYEDMVKNKKDLASSLPRTCSAIMIDVRTEENKKRKEEY